FQPRLSSKEILAQFDGERRSFLRQLFSQSQRGRTCFKLDVDTAATTLRQPRQRLVPALEHLHERDMLELRSAGMRTPYQRVQTPPAIDALAAELFQRFQQREKREIGRLREILTLVELDGCQVTHLCAHFGETLDGACGHC